MCALTWIFQSFHTARPDNFTSFSASSDVLVSVLSIKRITINGSTDKINQLNPKSVRKFNKFKFCFQKQVFVNLTGHTLLI